MGISCLKGSRGAQCVESQQRQQAWRQISTKIALQRIPMEITPPQPHPQPLIPHLPPPQPPSRQISTVSSTNPHHHPRRGIIPTSTPTLSPLRSPEVGAGVASLKGSWEADLRDGPPPATSRTVIHHPQHQPHHDGPAAPTVMTSTAPLTSRPQPAPPRPTNASTPSPTRNQSSSSSIRINGRRQSRASTLLRP